MRFIKNRLNNFFHENLYLIGSQSIKAIIISKPVKKQPIMLYLNNDSINKSQKRYDTIAMIAMVIIRRLFL